MRHTHIHGVGIDTPANCALWLWEHTNIRALLTNTPGHIPNDVVPYLTELRALAEQWKLRSTDEGTKRDSTPELDRTWVSTKQASDKLGITKRGVVKAIEKGKIDARKVDGTYRIPRTEVERYRSDRRTP